MKNFKLNLKGLYGYSQPFSSSSLEPRDDQEMSERRPSEERTLLAPLPQRFARYAAMLIMLLTLGVGQMWAMDVKKPKVYFNNQTPNWSTSNFYFAVGHSSYTRLYYTTTISNTKLQYVNLGDYDCSYCSCDCQQWGDATYVAFCRTTSAWDQAGSYGYSNIQNAQKYSGQKNNYSMNSGDTYYCYMANATNGAALSVEYKSGYSGIPKFNATQSAKKRDTGTTYSTVSGSWPATLKLKGTYLSGDGASTQSTITSTASTDEDAKKVYGAVVTGKITHSYTSLNSSYYFEGWGTGDTPSSTDATYSYNISAATTVYAFFSKLYTLNFDKKGTYGTSTISASVANYTSISSGNKVPTGHTITITASPATGYEVEGWYSDASCTSAYTSGSGGVTISGSGNVTFTLASLNANGGIYCKFQKKTYSITLDDNGDYQGNGSATVQRGDASLTVSSHASRTSWNLVGYWTGSGVSGSQVADAEGVLLTSVSGYTDGSGTWIYDGDVSLYAHWSQTYSLTVSAGSNISSVTGSNADVTLGNKYDITATPNTGYSFSGWTASPAENGAFDDASSSSTKVQVNNGSVTVTASATEIMSTLSTSCSYDVGNPSYAAPTVSGSATNVGYATTRTITATVAGTGYTLAGWTITNGTRTDGGGATANPITVRSNGDGAAVTVVANYTEDLSSPYILKGGSAFGGTAWSTQRALTKKTGHSTESVAYYTATMSSTNNGGSANHNFDFKIWKGGTAYGLPADGDCYWYFRSSGQQTLSLSGKNIELRADGTGEYEIKVDYTTSASPKITVTFPVDGNYEATLSAGDNGSVANAGAITLHSTPALSITATPDPGYRFLNWTVDGAHSSYVSIADVNSASTTVTASAGAEGATITANFTNDGFVYFDRSAVNGVWTGDKVYMTCLNSSDLTWDGSTGALVVKNWVHNDVHNKEMSRIPNTNIYYYDCSGHLPNKILFTDKSHAGDNYKLWQMGAVVEWANVDLGYDNMFVVENYVWQSKNNTGYFEGYWMKYNDTYSGLELQVFDEGGTSLANSPVDFTTARAGDRQFEASIALSATTAYKFKVKAYNGNWYGNSGTMTNTNCTGWDFLDRVDANCYFRSTGAGTYNFTLNCTNTGKLKVSMKFPLDKDDYRVVYNGKINTGAGSSHPHPSDFIRHLTSAGSRKDTVSFFVTGSDWTLQLQKCSTLNPLAWVNEGSAKTAASLGSPATGTHLFEVEQVHNGSSITVTIKYLEPYTGNYYIRTNAASGGWEAYKTTSDNKMEYSSYSKEHSDYDYYHCHFASTGQNVKFTIANDYSSCITDTVENDAFVTSSGNLPYQASVRFMFNSEKNVISRAYLNGSSEGGESTYLWMEGTTAGTKRILDTEGNRFTDNKVKFGDDGNWIYRADIKAEEGARIKLISNYRFNNTDHKQWFKGTNADWSDASTEQILGGSSYSESHLIRVIYDYKTNHLVSAWLADDEEVSGTRPIHTSVMVVREGQGGAKQITFSGSDSKLTEVDTVYAVMQFNKWTINNKSKESGHAALSPSLSTHERGLYWISFPFDVKLNDVFGFGTYGEHWIIEYYDGKGRAANGFWAESPVNWKFVLPAEKKDYVLKAFEGYVLALDLDNMSEDNDVWKYVEDVSLYFPSAKSVGSIVKQDTTISIDQTGYECTIDRSGEIGGNGEPLGSSYDRTKRDSYWHCIGVPSYANNTHGYNTGYSTTDEYYYPSSWTSENIPFYYEWNPTTNALSPKSTGSSMEFKAMYSYLVQYSHTTMAWTSTTIAPKTLVARQKAEDIRFAEFRLELMKGEESVDHTFVRLSDNEEVTSGFEFGHDLCKEFNNGKANIYTLVGDVQVAGNSLPLETEKTTIVPVGVKIVAEGSCTFAIPGGTNGVGVTLVDTENGTRTNLALGDYAVNLKPGTYDTRFVLEISPVLKTPTDIENVQGDEVHSTNVRKVMVDGVLYIVKEGQIYDARGARVQ